MVTYLDYDGGEITAAEFFDLICTRPMERITLEGDRATIDGVETSLVPVPSELSRNAA
jgi:hypothetical protein